MKRFAVLGLVLGLGLRAPAAAAASDPPWSVESAQSVGAGSNVVWGQVGFPGLWAEFIHGTDGLTEIGAKFGFDYALQGVVSSCCHPGLDLQFLLRTKLFDNGKIRIAGSFDPGVLLHFPGSTQFGITFPLAVEFGFPVSSVVSLNASFDLPMYVLFSDGGNSGYFAIPILFGGGAEYLLDPNVALTFKLKLGPTIVTGGGQAQFTLYAMFGAAYKF